jgi:hypothetical protein
MDKWVELKNWIEKGIKSLEDLANEAQFNYSNPTECDRLHNRKREFEQFFNKMNEIENTHQNKYKCPECEVVATDKQWDETAKIVYGEDCTSINDDFSNSSYEENEYCCPKCLNRVQGYKISKVL